MHYTGMKAAAQFRLARFAARRVGLGAASLAPPIIVVTIAVLAVALITSVLDMRLEIRTAAWRRLPKRTRNYRTSSCDNLTSCRTVCCSKTG